MLVQKLLTLLQVSAAFNERRSVANKSTFLSIKMGVQNVSHGSLLRLRQLHVAVYHSVRLLNGEKVNIFVAFADRARAC